MTGLSLTLPKKKKGSKKKKKKNKNKLNFHFSFIKESSSTPTLITPYPNPNPNPNYYYYYVLLRLFKSLYSVLTFICLFFVCKPLKLVVSSMDDLLSAEADDSCLFDLDYYSRSRPLLRFSNDDDYDEFSSIDKVYLVPYRWWKETQSHVGGVEGILYTANSKDGRDLQISLDLRREDNLKGIDEEEGFSGSEFALVPESLWLQALKWYIDSATERNPATLVAQKDQLHDVFPLQIRLSLMRGSKSLIVKITQRDNLVEFYRRACDIFITESELLHIWDFSGQTALFFNNQGNHSPNELCGSQGQEVLLEVQVHGLSCYMMSMPVNHAEISKRKSDSPFFSDSLMLNGDSNNFSSSFRMSNSYISDGYGVNGFLGLKGLQNLGNTCFMNSAVQCLIHTPGLVDYFLGDYRKEINYGNPLGMQGELAIAFGDLVRKIWAPGTAPVTPRMFKSKLAKFAPQFSGYNQHDSQEFLAFLLDGLHEDLNRVKQKPYIEMKDAGDRRDDEVAEEYWNNHLARNDSIIVDSCQGQYRSKLVCPACKKVSVTFDPFMYLTLPLPSTTMRSMTVTIIHTDGIAPLSPLTVTVPNSGTLKDLMLALRSACSLSNDETLLVAEVYNHRILRFLEDPTDSLDLIRDNDQIVAYQLPDDCDMSIVVEFVQQKAERGSLSQQIFSPLFGFPLVTKVSGLSYGYEVCNLFMKLIDPFLKPRDGVSHEFDDLDNSASANEDSEMEDAHTPWDTESDAETEDDPNLSNDFKFCTENFSKIKMNEPLEISRTKKSIRVLVIWPEKMFEKYDTGLLNDLPDIFRPQLFARSPQEPISLYKCVEAFLKQEPLGPEDMWYCPNCKKHRLAIKKLDLWRLPRILVVHLKRFSYSRFLKNKLDTFVDFPLDNLDLSSYITHSNSQMPCRYVLYAISNHYGGMGGGHYTAFVNDRGDSWYEFDDERVAVVDKKEIKMSAAYVLFYRRVPSV